MGLQKRACKPVGVILPFDTSIRSEAGYIDYIKSIYTDEGSLDLDPSDPPVRFTMRQWTDAHKDYIGCQESDRATWKAGVRCALTAHSGYAIVDEDGTAKPAPPIELKTEGRLGFVVPMSWFSDVVLPDDHLEHLYIAARNVSEAAPPLSQPSAPESGQPKSESPESSAE